MKVSVSQFKSLPQVAANLDVVKRHIALAAQQGARVVAFPEASMVAYEFSRQQLVDVAARESAAFLAEVSAAAREHAVHVFIGVYEPFDAARTDNVFVHIGPQGDVLGRYRKMHLYDAFSFQESEKNHPGELLPNHGEVYVVSIEGLRFAILNCYDLRFPEIARIAVDKGADVLIYGAGWISGSFKELHWETLLKARAIENTCYVLASCQPPPTSVGMSMVIDPNGLTIAGVAGKEDIATAEIGAQRLREVREELPCLSHRRYRIAAN